MIKILNHKLNSILDEKEEVESYHETLPSKAIHDYAKNIGFKTNLLKNVKFDSLMLFINVNIVENCDC